MEKNSVTKNLVLTGICLAISIIMPTVFHFAGPNGGKMFLPLFWGVGIAALIVPMKNVILISIAAPLLSHFISKMPPIPMLYFMIVEILVYGIILNISSKKINIFLSILLSLVISRITYIISVLFAANVLNIPVPFAKLPILLTGVITSVPGIIVQIIVIPLIYKAYLKVSKESK